MSESHAYEDDFLDGDDEFLDTSEVERRMLGESESVDDDFGTDEYQPPARKPFGASKAAPESRAVPDDSFSSEESWSDPVAPLTEAPRKSAP